MTVPRRRPPALPDHARPAPSGSVRPAPIRWLRRALRGPALLGAVLAASPLVAPAASTAGLTQVASFGSNPGNLAMYVYPPAALPAHPAVVVALHGCTQSASDYYASSGWPTFADRYGFVLVFPQQNTANNSNKCFNWFQSADNHRDQGEALSIKQMASTALSSYAGDPSRVYVTGLSAGGVMTSVMLATYPDVFAGGGVVAGIPYGCANDLTSAYSCMSPGVDKTPAQWAQVVHDAYAGYSGPYPRVAIWHGTSDTTVVPMNATESRDEWVGIHGLSTTPTSTESLPGSGHGATSRETYADSSGRAVVQVNRVQGMAHGTPVDPGTGSEECGVTGAYFLDYICSSYHITRFWGLDGSGGPGTGLPAPTGLTVSAVTDTSISLAWNAVSTATSYALYRGSSKVTTTATSYTDTGLSSGTTYSYSVAALDSAGTEGARSATVSATTTGFVPTCSTANNYQHVQAGRAVQRVGYVYAKGSDQYMGLYNTYTTHTLKQTSLGYYVLADNGCP